MANEDFIVRDALLVRDDEPSDFEEILEGLLLIARSQGRNFLSYLLVMALMHVREDSKGRSGVPH